MHKFCRAVHNSNYEYNEHLLATKRAAWCKMRVMFGLCLSVGLGCFVQPLYANHLKVKKNHKHCMHVYRVKANDTLYGIAHAQKVPYRLLINYNHLKAPYVLRIGQQLRWPCHLPSTAHRAAKQLMTQHVPHRTVRRVTWIWPTHGKPVPASRLILAKKQGIVISGHFRQPIFASANGIVIYAGHALPGYGNLLLIRHKHGFITAYACNDRLLVNEGDRVMGGQKIAQMGRVSGGKVLLYFEIRYNGYPVNPFHYLPRKVLL